MNSPVKVIEINFNIFQKNDGTGNFQNTESDKHILLSMVDRLNEIYSSICPTSDPFDWVVELPNNDSRIRFDIGEPGHERIYFYKNDDIYGTSSAYKMKSFVESVDSNRMKQLNIYITEGYFYGRLNENIVVTEGGYGYTSAPTVTFKSKETGYGAKATAQIQNGKVVSITLDNTCKDSNGNPKLCSGSYSGGRESVEVLLTGGDGLGASAKCYVEGGANGYATVPSNSNMKYNNYTVLLHHSTGYRDPALLAHELGHNLFLYHPWENSYCNSSDYLNDVFGNKCPLSTINGWAFDPFAVNGDGITNNLMNYGPGNYTYLSPMQIGIMHRSLSLSSVRKYVKECYSNIPLVITDKQDWDFDIRLYRDIEIKLGGELRVSCNLVIAEQANIILNTGGKLIIDGAVSTNTGNIWQGIIVNNGGILEIVNTDIQNYNITVNSGGTIKFPSNSNVAIINNSIIDVKKYGYVCIDSAADIELRNPLSCINLHDGFYWGVHPFFVGSSNNCVSNVSNINYTGKGSVNFYSSDVYIQNQALFFDEYITGKNISAGTNVTASKPQGNVVIKNGTCVIFEAENETLLHNGFEVELGAEFEVK